MRTPAAKFAVPFKSTSLTNSQAIPALSRCDESLNHLPPSSDQQHNKKRRCKDILSGLSQDSNISTQTLNTRVACSPVDIYSATKSNTLLLKTHKRCKVTHKNNASTDATHEADALLPQHLEVVAKQIRKHRKDKLTTSSNINDTGEIQISNTEVEAKRKIKRCNDVPTLPSGAHDGAHFKGAYQARKSTADTNQTGPDVYKFSMSPTSPRKQRQRIRKLQARERMKRKLLELIANMHSEMQELRERHRVRCAAKHKGTDKPGKILYNTAGNRKKSPTYAFVQASTACPTISINKEYILKPSGSVQPERVCFTDRGRGRTRLVGVEQ